MEGPVKKNKWRNPQPTQLTDYECARYTTTVANLRKTLDEYGVAIIPSVLDEAECASLQREMWDFFEHLLPGVSRDDSATWKSILSLLPLHSMLFQHYSIGHAQFAWTARQNPKILDIFVQLLGAKSPEELLVSFDGSSFHIPPEITKRGAYSGQANWFHTDQRLSDSRSKCIQSWVTPIEVAPGDATLTVLEGSHLLHGDFATHFGYTGEKEDWHKLESQPEWDFYSERNCKRVCIACPPGSIVFWDSRTIHAGQEPLKIRPVPKFRMAIYLSYALRTDATNAMIKKKQKAFKEMRTTNHWAANPKLFSKTPRTYGAALPTTREPIPPLNMNAVGLKLAGF
jgi:hypothetical protein